MKNKKNDGKYVIIDDGTAGGLFLSENEYYVDENKKVVLCNSEKKDNLFRKRYKLTHGDKCYSIIKYFCPEVEFISIKIMETGERGSIDSFKAALEWCLKEKIRMASKLPSAISKGFLTIRPKDCIGWFHSCNYVQ